MPDCNVAFTPIEVDINMAIVVEVEFAHEITLDMDFPLTQAEMNFMESLTGSKKEQRREKIMRLHFGMKYTLEQVGQVLGGISAAAVSYEISAMKEDVIKFVRKDIRAHKKLLRHMVDQMLKSEARDKEIWQQYVKLENESSGLREALKRMQDEKKAHPELFKRREIGELAAGAQAIVIIINTQAGLLAQARHESEHMLQIWNTFGLCGEEALKLIVSGGIDIEMKIKEVRAMIVNVTDIVSEEVTDMNQRKRIFTRLARQVKITGYVGTETKSNDDEDY
ncbi:MAG: hypothetical protein KJ661_05865 [Candidatus Omnitrophica bacterium]|nr:hypothetical protein [Candidatus Omnitrophota bacterium]